MELWKGESNLINIKIQKTNLNGGHDCQGIHTREIRTLNNKTIAGTGSLNNKTITYSEHALRKIGRQVRQDQRLLPFGAVSTIRSLRINHKPQKSAKDK